MGMKAPARGYTEINDETEITLIGESISGTFSPCLKAPIAKGYVEIGKHKAGTEAMML